MDKEKQMPTRGLPPRCAFDQSWCEAEATVYVCWDKSQVTEKEDCPKIGGWVCDSGLATTHLEDCEIAQEPAPTFDCPNGVKVAAEVDCPPPELSVCFDPILDVQYLAIECKDPKCSGAPCADGTLRTPENKCSCTETSA